MFQWFYISLTFPKREEGIQLNLLNLLGMRFHLNTNSLLLPKALEDLVNLLTKSFNSL